MNIGPMLNAYPDSMGGTLDDIALFLQKPEMKEVFSSCYIFRVCFILILIVAFLLLTIH